MIGRNKYCSVACQTNAVWNTWQAKKASKFWAKVDKHGPVPGHESELGSCWIWTGHTRVDGYATIRVGHANQGKRMFVHRFSWELQYDPIPKDLSVCHRCDTPLCVRPDHLFVGTIADNNVDMRSKGRARGGPGPNGANRQWGEQASNRKLTWDQVEAIRREWNGTLARANELAVKYGVYPNQVRRVAKGYSWTSGPGGKSNGEPAAMVAMHAPKSDKIEEVNSFWPQN